MRVVLKSDLNHYGYKNSFYIDAQHGFIRHFVVNPANIHDDYELADSGEHFKDLLSLAGFENRIYEKGSRNCFATSMGGKFTKKLVLKEIKLVEHEKSYI